MRQVTVEEAHVLLSSGARLQLVDCRQEWEHRICHLPGDKLLPLGELADRTEELDPAVPVLVYCHHGIRSINAAVYLESIGFSAMSMHGGIDAWSLRIDPAVPRY